MSQRTYFIFICFVVLLAFGLTNSAYSDDGNWELGELKDVSAATGPEEVPNLDQDEKLLENEDFLNCVCQCLEPAGGEFLCRYNTTEVGTPSTPSCENLSNGPCICEGMVGCFRAKPPSDGECYDRCKELFGPDAETEESPVPSPASPGDLVPGASIGLIPEMEPNDQIGDATEIVFASPVGVKGRITPAGDVDFFRFYIDTAGMLELQLDQVPDEMRSRIDLYGKNFNWIARKDASNPGDPVTFLVDMPGPGQGFIAISDLDRKAHPSDYSFVAEFLPAEDKGEPNDRVGDSTEIGLGQTINANICPVGDVDFYKLNADSAGILAVRLDQVPGDMRSRIDLYNKNFDRVTRKDASNPGDAIVMEVDLPGPASHYLAISDLDRKARSDRYSFQIDFKPAADSNEPNNQVGDSTEMDLGQTVTGCICPIDDVDFYKIRVDAPAMLEATLQKVPASMRARIDLYGKNFNWITRKDASNAGDAITLESDLGGPGVYYLAISDLERKAHDQQYMLMAGLKSE